MFFIFYQFSLKCGMERFKNICHKLYYIIAVIWLMAIIFSIISFLYNVGYGLITNPYTPEALTRQGFSENRLFGVFMSINVLAITSGVLLLISIYMLGKEKKLYAKGFCIINMFFDIIYIILSGSRSAYYGLLFYWYDICYICDIFIFKAEKECYCKVVFIIIRKRRFGDMYYDSSFCSEKCFRNSA